MDSVGGGEGGGTGSPTSAAWTPCPPFSMLRLSMARYPAGTRPCLAPAAITARYTGTQDGLGMCSSQPSSPTKDSLMARTCGGHTGWGQTAEVEGQLPLTGGPLLPSPVTVVTAMISQSWAPKVGSPKESSQERSGNL